MHLITMDTEMNIENKNLKFSSACTHNLTCRRLAKRGIKIVSERRQRQLMQQRTTVLLILVCYMYIGCYMACTSIIEFRGEVLNSM